MKNIYEWKMTSFAKGINPAKAVKELERIENIYGSITPQNILLAAENHGSLFHPLFMWDDAEAAVQYRLQQARTLLNNIEVKIVADGEQRKIPVYEIISQEEGRVYKHIDNFSPQDIEQVKKRTVVELNSLKNKLSIYKEFSKAILKVDELANIILEA